MVGALCIVMGLGLASAIGMAAAENKQKAAGTSQLAKNLSEKEQEKAKRCADKTLDFILAQQFEDGSFPMFPGQEKTTEGEITGYAALALIGHGGLGEKSPYRAPLEKAIDFLVSCQDESGRIGSTPNDNGSIYHHAYATAVLAKARGALDAERNERIEVALPRAVGLLLAAQKVEKKALSQGGWRYTPTSGDSDLSCTAAAIFALHSARKAMVEVPDEAFGLAADYAERLQTGDGGFGYMTASNPDLARGGMGIFILTAAGRGNTGPAGKAIDYLHAQLENSQGGGFLYYGVFWGSAATISSGSRADEKLFASWMYPYFFSQQAEDGGFGKKGNRIVPAISAALAMAAD